ncbi:helix-turn-helix transcriptional regulator, partial [Vibrio sp. FNV 38]|nr:helix-turn-helix transcriptional regulator [Vibrio sp. FNV 38]
MDNTLSMAFNAENCASNLTTSVILVTQSSLQSENFRRMLQDNTELPIQILPCSTSLLDYTFPDDSIVIVDLSSVGVGCNYCDTLRLSDNVTGTVLLNFEGELRVDEVLKWKALRGTFSPSDTLDHVCNGLKAIANGENWLPRKLVDRLIHYYEESSSNTQTDEYLVLELTRRELEILESLKSGGSNIEIA